jgi:RimJ/RimL family protein N-acetyltransferase
MFYLHWRGGYIMEIPGAINLKPYMQESCHEFFMAYVADPAMTYDAYAYEKDKVNTYYQTKVLDPTRRFFAVCYGGKVIGEIQIKRIDFERRCGTLSIALTNDTVKGRGFGTQAIRLILRYAIHELGLQTLYADAVYRNGRSRHVLEKAGFRHLYDDENLAYYELKGG